MLIERLSTSFPSLDAALNGGIVPGRLYFFYGPRGIGKTTLLLHIVKAITGAGQRAIYVSGEVAAKDTEFLAHRLGFSGKQRERTEVVVGNDVSAIEEHVGDCNAALLAVDSLQTVYLHNERGDVGRPRQMRAVARKLGSLEKCATLLIGHARKDGAPAGPSEIPHVADGVVHLSRAKNDTVEVTVEKHRGGPTPRHALLKMTSHGFREIS